MMGSRHIATSMTGVAAMSAWVFALGAGPVPAPVESFDRTVAIITGADEQRLTPLADLGRIIFEWVFPYGVMGAFAWAYLCTAALVALAGATLPDIDTRTSSWGHSRAGVVWRKLAGADAPHHGITHANWAYLAIFAASFWEPLRPLFFLAASWALHLWMDGLGVASRSRWYPLGKWKRVPIGAPRMVSDETSEDPEAKIPVWDTWMVVPLKFHKGWYRTGARSEILIAGLVVGVNACLTAAAVLLWLSGQPV